MAARRARHQKPRRRGPGSAHFAPSSFVPAVRSSLAVSTRIGDRQIIAWRPLSCWFSSRRAGRRDCPSACQAMTSCDASPEASACCHHRERPKSRCLTRRHRRSRSLSSIWTWVAAVTTRMRSSSALLPHVTTRASCAKSSSPQRGRASEGAVPSRAVTVTALAPAPGLRVATTAKIAAVSKDSPLGTPLRRCRSQASTSSLRLRRCARPRCCAKSNTLLHAPRKTPRHPAVSLTQSYRWCARRPLPPTVLYLTV